MSSYKNPTLIEKKKTKNTITIYYVLLAYETPTFIVIHYSEHMGRWWRRCNVMAKILEGHFSMFSNGIIWTYKNISSDVVHTCVGTYPVKFTYACLSHVLIVSS